MPYIDFGEELPTQGSKFLKLKSKGDKVQIRLLDRPFYYGQHFLKDEAGNWNVVPCSRINEGSECEYCGQYFSIIAKAKKTDDPKQIEEAKKKARAFQVSTQFYYPVLNRDTGRFQIFQTTKSVRDKIETEAKMGVEVLKTDFIILRAETSPQNYYGVTKVDSSQIKPLSKEEKEEIEKAKTIDLEDLIAGSPEEDSEVASQKEIADLGEGGEGDDGDDGDVPF
jgi:hypothetical protein